MVNWFAKFCSEDISIYDESGFDVKALKSLVESNTRPSTLELIQYIICGRLKINRKVSKLVQSLKNFK